MKRVSSSVLRGNEAVLGTPTTTPLFHHHLHHSTPNTTYTTPTSSFNHSLRSLPGQLVTPTSNVASTQRNTSLECGAVTQRDRSLDCSSSSSSSHSSLFSLDKFKAKFSGGVGSSGSGVAARKIGAGNISMSVSNRKRSNTSDKSSKSGNISDAVGSSSARSNNPSHSNPIQVPPLLM